MGTIWGRLVLELKSAGANKMWFEKGADATVEFASEIRKYHTPSGARVCEYL
jgi:hypothetical protein